ncbi:Aldo/keto reductase [Quillaja saponaria]|uniref:Aldo/keto reductase n=1 Tax=Quillaja saponaria TaxID=32244 RepID=A0AAD7QCG6_QUISA|nr:Aldo/keto reductase [Quillaja saponaria]
MSEITKIPEVVLSSSSGHRRMPMIGLGTASDSRDESATKTAVIEAIKLGYRHFDTATLYGSEQALGEAMAEAIQLGLVSREELFITTKLWCSDSHPHLVVSTLKKSLGALQLEYLDLYLVHFPVSAKPGKLEFPFDEEDLMPFDLKGVWTAMEECQNLGLTKSIGVSNFSSKKLQNLLSFASISPSVNQVEMNPAWKQKKLTEFCKENGIIITAYSPLGATGASWGTNDVVNNELLKQVANARGKTVAQVSLRWVYEQGVTLVFKSYNKQRLEQNLQIFDWSLTEDDYKKINQVNQRPWNKGPTKTPLDIWDGEYNIYE